MKTIINAKIDDSNNLYKIVFDEKILDVIKQDKTLKDDKSLDIEGKILIPGAVDSHVHFNDPGFTHNEDFTTGTSSAALGGITTIVDMPCTSLPPVTSKENLENKLSKIEKKAFVDFVFWGGVNGHEDLDIDKLRKLRSSGASAFKIYTISGMETYGSLSYKKIEELFKMSINEDFIFAFHAEDLETIENNKKNLSPDEKTTVSGYLKIRDKNAEIRAIKNIVDLARKYNTKIHIVHLSTKEGLEIIKSYKFASTETAPHYLHFTKEDLYNLKGRLKTAPVVKNKEDKLALLDGIKDGSINFIATDHAGTDWDKNKDLEDFSKVYNGIPGTSTMLAFIFTYLYDKKIIDLKRVVDISSKNAAKLHGIYPKKGSLDIGSDADFTIMKKENYIFDEKTLISKGKYSPFHNTEFKYRVFQTILRGEIIYNDGKITNMPSGKFIKSKYL